MAVAGVGAYGDDGEAEGGHKGEGGGGEPVGGDARHGLGESRVGGVDPAVGANRQRRRICSIDDLQKPQGSCFAGLLP